MFIEMEMKWLASFPKDVYAVGAKIGDAPITPAAYGFTQLGVHPATLKMIGLVDGDVPQFEIDFAPVTILESTDPITKEVIPASTIVKYRELDPAVDTLPTGYVQTCCNQFLYGNTLTKAAIVAWQYTFDEEMAMHRNQIDLGDLTSPSDEYIAYSMFIDSIPSDTE